MFFAVNRQKTALMNDKAQRIEQNDIQNIQQFFISKSYRKKKRKGEYV